MDNFEVVYKFSDELPDFWVLLMSLFMIFIGLANILSGRNKIFGYFWVTIWSIILIFSSYFIFGDYFQLQNTYEDHKYNVVEGVVENFVAARGACEKSTEEFDINNVHFEKWKHNYGYNKLSCNGGRIKQGAFMRICYTEMNNEKYILKVEVKK